jgi:hypothetical membrane protein
MQRRLAQVAISGAVLYVLVDVILFLVRPDLSLQHNAESDYGNGRFSWLMDIRYARLRTVLSQRQRLVPGNEVS